MNQNILEGKWMQLRGAVREKWGELTDDELDQIAGKRDKLAGILQERYGYGQMEAEREIDDFLERIEAGVVYVNRKAGATTGAWPGVQPFGGWKGSGSGGKAGGGPYYLQQYLREQSRTIVEEQG